MNDERNQSYQKQVFDLIKKVTGECNVLTIPRELIEYTGDLDSALLLSQIIYWTDKTKSPQGYIYKTYKEWEEEIWLNEYKVRKATTTLKKLGILETKLKKANGAPTIHYKLDSVKFKESILQNLKNRNCKNSRIDSVKFKESITETTAETKTKTTTSYSKNSYKKSMKFTDYEQREYDPKQESELLEASRPKTIIDTVYYWDGSGALEVPRSLATIKGVDFFQTKEECEEKYKKINPS